VQVSSRRDFPVARPRLGASVREARVAAAAV